MEAYLPMSSGEWGEAGVGESTFHGDSKDVLASAFGLHGTLIVRGSGQGWASGLNGFRCLKNSSALGGRRKSVTEGLFRCVTQFVTQRDAHKKSLLKRFSSNRLRYLSTL